jgi:phosphate transport system permease protein
MNRIRLNRLRDKIFLIVGIFSTFIGLILLVIFLGDVFKEGFARLSWDFLTNLPSRIPQKAGIFTAMMGTIWILILTAIIAFPIGVAAGIYSKNMLRRTSIREFSISIYQTLPSSFHHIRTTRTRNFRRFEMGTQFWQVVVPLLCLFYQ